MANESEQLTREPLIKGELPRESSGFGPDVETKGWQPRTGAQTMSAKVTERHRQLYLQLCGLLFVDETTCMENSERGSQLLAHAEQQARLEEWEELARPYPESIFRPLSDEELSRCVDALMNSGVGAASDRLHAGWARHWSKQRIAALKAEVKP